MTEQEIDNKQTFTSSHEPYEVGYGRPPKHSQFQKGQSGNLNGRPKGTQNLRDQMLEVYTRPVNLKQGSNLRSVPRVVALLEVQFQQALKADVPSQKAVFNNLKELGGLDQEPDSSVPEAEKYELTNEELDDLTDDQFELIIKAQKIRTEVVARRSIH